MSDPKEKKKFDWKSGEALTQDLYRPIGQIREEGFSKLADGLPADPQVRKVARKKKIEKKNKEAASTDLLLEESNHSLRDDFTPSDASRLIGKDRDLKGINRFSKKPSAKKGS